MCIRDSTFTKRCLEAGKSVCTSNKELVARHGAELLEIARERELNYLFEASVGGGIPIIRPLNSSLTADEITEITGILNGTTNYILTKMSYGGTDFDTALKDAQAKGYAERNPEADVEMCIRDRAMATPAVGIALAGTGCLLTALGILLSFVMVWCCIKIVPWLIRGLVGLVSYPFRKAGAKK